MQTPHPLPPATSRLSVVVASLCCATRVHFLRSHSSQDVRASARVDNNAARKQRLHVLDEGDVELVHDVADVAVSEVALRAAPDGAPEALAKRQVVKEAVDCKGQRGGGGVSTATQLRPLTTSTTHARPRCPRCWTCG